MRFALFLLAALWLTPSSHAVDVARSRHARDEVEPSLALARFVESDSSSGAAVAVREVALVATAAALAIVAAIMSATASILSTLTAAVAAPAAAHVRLIEGETQTFLTELLDLYAGAAGDVQGRFSDAVQDVGVWVLASSPGKEVLATAKAAIASDAQKADRDLDALRALLAPSAGGKISISDVRAELTRLLRGEYDASIGFGIDKAAAKRNFVLFSGVAPSLGKLASAVKTPAIYLHAGEVEYVGHERALGARSRENLRDESSVEEAIGEIAGEAASGLRDIGVNTVGAPISVLADMSGEGKTVFNGINYFAQSAAIAQSALACVASAVALYAAMPPFSALR